METFSLFIDYSNVSLNYKKSLYEIIEIVKEIIGNKVFLYKCIAGSGNAYTNRITRESFERIGFDKCCLELKEELRQAEQCVDTILCANVMNILCRLSEDELKRHTMIIMSGDGAEIADSLEPSICKTIKHSLKKCKVNIISWRKSINRFYVRIEDMIDNLSINYLDDIDNHLCQMPAKITQQKVGIRSPSPRMNSCRSPESHTNNNTNKRKRYRSQSPSPSNDSPSNDSPSNDSPSNDSPSNDSPSHKRFRRYTPPLKQLNTTHNHNHTPTLYDYNNSYQQYQNGYRGEPNNNNISYNKFWRKPDRNPDKLHNYKRSICKFYNTQKGCKYVNNCSFAHGENELRRRGPMFLNNSCPTGWPPNF